MKANFWSTASRNAGHRFSITPYITPRLTPTGTPKIISASVSPRGYSVVGSPQQVSGTNSPTKVSYDGRTSLSSWYPSSQQSSAANSPPRGRSLPGLDELHCFSRVLGIYFGMIQELLIHLVP